MYFIQWMNLCYSDCIWIESEFYKLSYPFVLLRTDILHYIILYFIVLMLMYFELSFCSIKLVDDCDLICKL